MLEHDKKASGAKKTKAIVEPKAQDKKVGKGLTYAEGAAKLAPKDEKPKDAPRAKEKVKEQAKAKSPEKAEAKAKGKAKDAAQAAPAEVFAAAGYTDVDAKALSLYWGVGADEVIDKVGAYISENKGPKAAIDEYLRQAYTMYDPSSDPEIAKRAFSKADAKLLASHFGMSVAEAQEGIEEMIKMYGPEFVEAKIAEAKAGQAAKGDKKAK